MAERIDLVVIDPQVSFCDKATDELYVPNAENDVKRIAEMINRFGKKINKIHVSMDCHHFFDISHMKFWRNSKGQNPDPFTIITHQDTVDKVWFPIFKSLPGHSDAQAYVEYYTKELEKNGRFQHCTFPNHCLIGSDGNKIMPVLFQALINWQEKNHNNVNYVSKGSCVITENFSIIQAEVPSPDFPETQLNTAFIQTLMDTDRILIAGEAGSHCLKFSTEDIANNFNDDTYIKKIT
ncbi:MAG TPA: hypothetical protein VMZ91_10910, partial [Candidatus Paceibacterota bacterium]|nr:hypothetical protein [Candidatus Paceibacterota bacterium]